MMRAFWFALAALFFTACVPMASYAAPMENGNVNISGLSDKQIADLVAEAARLREANSQARSPEEQAKVIAAWADIGKQIGVGLAATAKELGVAVNDFSNTGVGKLTMVLIVWHVMGHGLILMGFGVLWLTFGIVLWMRYFNKLVMPRLSGEGEWTGGDWGVLWLSLVVLAAICLVGILTLLNSF